MVRSIPPIALAVIFVGGCAEPGEQERATEVVVRDSAGVRIIDNGPLPQSDTGRSLTPAVEIGVVEGEAAYQFFRVSDAKRLRDGAIAITNSGTRELRIYQPDGTHGATAGGAGQGPAEFRYPTTLVILPEDTIQVQDFLDRVYFNSDGEFLRRETGDRQALAELAQAAGGTSEGGGWLGNGTFFAPIYEPMYNPPRPGPPFRPSITLVRVSSDFSRLDTLGQFGGILQQVVDVGEQHGASATVPPFATNTWWDLGSSDGTVIVGDNAIPQIQRFHPDGTRSIVRWAGEAHPVTTREVEEWKERNRKASWAQGRLPQLERAWTAMEVPETKPYYTRVMAGSDGTLWVTTDDPGQGTRARVFGPDGVFEGTVQFSDQFRVYDSGPGWVLGLQRDENEVEYVQLYQR